MKESMSSTEGRKLLRLEVRNAETPIERKPDWIRTTAKMGPEYQAMQSLVKSEGLHTVCQEAGCPNIYECWEDREATFLIGGSQCTRRCDFCQIDTGKPDDFDADEPRRVGESVATMKLRYATVTGVARDDLDDEGAWLYAETIREIHRQSPGTGVEILVPDFSGNPELLGLVFDAAPEVFAHNVETVPRIFKRIRPAFRYDRSLDVITQGRNAGLITKSNLILGMGEERAEIWMCPSLKVWGKLGEAEADFRARLVHAAHEGRDAALAKAREAAEKKTKVLEGRLRTAEVQLSKEKAESGSAKMQAGITVLGGILKSVFGRKSGFGGLTSGTTSVTKATTAYKQHQDVANAEAKISGIQEEVESIRKALEKEVEDIGRTFDPLTLTLEKETLKPTRTDVKVVRVGLLWM
jgi:lipoate synthase